MTCKCLILLAQDHRIEGRDNLLGPSMRSAIRKFHVYVLQTPSIPHFPMFFNFEKDLEVADPSNKRDPFGKNVKQIESQGDMKSNVQASPSPSQDRWMLP